MTNPTLEGEELVRTDDAVIGRAVRWSLLALLLLAAGVAGVVYWATRTSAPPPERITEIAAPVAPERAMAEVPAAPFVDITAAAGIKFVHNNGAAGEKLLPETMGSGCAFFDFDGDADQDLLFVNATEWPAHVGGTVPPRGKPTTPRLYRNDGAGNFEDVTASSGLDVSLYGMGAAVSDYDNDGDVDVFISAVGGNRLFRNDGAGKFTDATADAGVANLPSDWSTACAFFDYDNDGLLDLFVANYIRWSRDNDFEVGYTLIGDARAYGPPTNFEGAFPYLYHNEGGGRFKDVSAEAGVQVQNSSTGVPAAKSLGVAPADLDGDGWIDFIVANDTVQNFVFHNQKDGTFKEMGALSGVGFDSSGAARGAMGIDVARHRNDARGTLAIGIGNFANEMTALFVSQGGPESMLFTDEAIAEGVGPVSRLPLKFGLFFFDYDLDGWQDLLTANGHIEDEINKVQQSQHYRQPAQLFWNSGGARKGGGFVPVGPDKAGADLFKPIVGRGSAFADIDGDGDLDVVLTQVAGPPLLLRNDLSLGHHWLRLKLIGDGRRSNRDAIGAWVKVHVGGTTLWRQVMPTRSYLSQSELPVTIGLGTATRPDSVEIIWPGGHVQKVNADDVKVDGVTVIEQE